MKKPGRVALIHDWLTGMRGGEKVLEVLCEIFPQAEIFTLIHEPGALSRAIESHPIRASFLQKLPGGRKHYRRLLPLMPWAVERFRFEGFDLVVSSSHCAAKGAKAPGGVPHICYCHTPMRYIWDQYGHYFAPGRASLPVRAAMALLRKPLQAWDVASAGRVSAFAANSAYVAGRIRRYYGRPADVIHPPVDMARYPGLGEDRGYYLAVSALVPYKRVDVAVEAFRRLALPLKIAGSGPELAALRASAPDNVEFLGWVDDEKLGGLYRGCRALIFPGEEDFGIVPLEAMACGKPVIALGKGGVMESVRGLGATEPGEAPTGLFFSEQAAESLENAVRGFEKNRAQFDPAKIRARAALFDRPIFKDKLEKFILEKYNELK